MVRASATTLESECTEAERALMQRILTTSDLKDRHLEIGTAAGGTLKELIKLYSDRGSVPQFCVIDPLSYYPNQREIIERNLVGAGIDPDSVEFWQGITLDLVTRERSIGGRFDFVFIDGDHRAYPVTVDLQWADLVNKGGFIFLHDSSPKFPGVTWAIERFLQNCPEFEKVGQEGSLVVLHKVAERSKPCVAKADLVAARWWQLRFKWARSLRKRLG